MRSSRWRLGNLLVVTPSIARNAFRRERVRLRPQLASSVGRALKTLTLSPLARINKGNVKNLKLAYAIPLGGGSGNEYLHATPLAENGFLYITDSWGVLYKIDGTAGDVGRIVWRMDPKQQRQARNRGAALWGNLVITAADSPPRIIATDKETGQVIWESSFADTPEVA